MDAFTGNTCLPSVVNDRKNVLTLQFRAVRIEMSNKGLQKTSEQMSHNLTAKSKSELKAYGEATDSSPPPPPREANSANN